MQERKSPWMTRDEAAAYLLWTPKHLDKFLVAAKEFVPGRMRRSFQNDGKRHRVRVWAEDVYAMCPPPKAA